MYVVSPSICKAAAAESFKTEAAETITLSPPPQKKSGKKYCAGQTERMKTEEPVYCVSSREAAHLKAQSL